MNQSDNILELARRRRVLRAADVREHGWSPQLLIRLYQAGKLQRIDRGLYGLPDADVTEHQTLIEVCQRIPKAVLCLLSALQYHEIGTQLPHEVWIALPEATQTPALSDPTLRITRLRGAAYSEGSSDCPTEFSPAPGCRPPAPPTREGGSTAPRLTGSFVCQILPSVLRSAS